MRGCIAWQVMNALIYQFGSFFMSLKNGGWGKKLKGMLRPNKYPHKALNCLSNVQKKGGGIKHFLNNVKKNAELVYWDIPIMQAPLGNNLRNPGKGSYLVTPLP